MTVAKCIFGIYVKDLKKLLANVNDEDVVVFGIFDEKAPDVLRFCSDVADAKTLEHVCKSAHETSEGTRNVVRIALVLDLEPCD